MRPATPWSPFVGMLAVEALMAALRRRRQTGQGTFIDLAQREVMVSMLGEAILDYSLTGRVTTPRGNRHPLLRRVSTRAVGILASSEDADV